MCSRRSNSGNFTTFVQKTAGSCLKPARGSTVEPVKLSSKQRTVARSDHAAAAVLQTKNSSSSSSSSMEEMVEEMFGTVSDLKVSYVRLQEAHVPYDVEKIQAADRDVIRQMKKLSELKQFYKEKAPRSRALEQKEAEIRSLKEALEKNRHYTGPALKLVESNMARLREASLKFTKCLVSLMKAAGWDLDAAANSIEPGMAYGRAGDKKWAFQSYLCGRMLEGFEHETFRVTGPLPCVADAESHRRKCLERFRSMEGMEPLEAVGADGLFGKFCLSKFLQAVHPKMEESFFGNLEHRNQIARGVHPCSSPFYGVFLRFAKAVWLLHSLAFSFDPSVSIFFVGRGSEFDGTYMENLNLQRTSGNGNWGGDGSEFDGTCMEDLDLERKIYSGNGNWGDGNDERRLIVISESKVVGFTVMPGLRIGNKVVVRCQVYAEV